VNTRYSLFTLIASILFLVVCVANAHADTRVMRPTNTEIGSVVSTHADVVRQCYQENLIGDQAVAEFTLDIVISPSGRVRGVYVSGLSFSQAAYLEKCVATHAQHWQFPRTGVRTAVRTPFLFVLARR
jgi:hypothetical protein